MQSIIGDNFKVAKQFLNNGRKVLFSGTPCQIAGLKNFLRKDYENLLTVEVVCHGVPSPMVWRDYLDYRCATISKGFGLKYKYNITSISFRDKSNGWEQYGLKICDTSKCVIVPGYKDLFLKGFLKDIFLRPSCHFCCAKNCKSGADISIGDYWGFKRLSPHFDDGLGISLILINTKNGSNYFYKVESFADIQISKYSDAYTYNKCILYSPDESEYRTIFWNLYAICNVEAIRYVCKITRPSVISRVKSCIWRLLRK